MNTQIQVDDKVIGKMKFHDKHTGLYLGRGEFCVETNHFYVETVTGRLLKFETATAADIYMERNAESIVEDVRDMVST